MAQKYFYDAFINATTSCVDVQATQINILCYRGGVQKHYKMHVSTSCFNPTLGNQSQSRFRALKSTKSIWDFWEKHKMTAMKIQSNDYKRQIHHLRPTGLSP